LKTILILPHRIIDFATAEEIKQRLEKRREDVKVEVCGNQQELQSKLRNGSTEVVSVALISEGLTKLAREITRRYQKRVVLLLKPRTRSRRDGLLIIMSSKARPREIDGSLLT